MTTLGSDSDAGRLTMLEVSGVIAHHCEAMTEHSFLKGLERQGSMEQFRGMLQHLAFFSLVFQDVLRLAQERCTDPRAKAIARDLQSGDKGHEQWYLEDLERLGIPLDIRLMFSESQAPARDVGYKLVSEMLSLTDDRSRLSVILALEAMAHEFFVRVPAFAKRVGAPGLKYFGLDHLAAEDAHQIRNHDSHHPLAAIEVPDEIAPEVLSTVERTFALMAEYGDHLAAIMHARGFDIDESSKA